MRLVLVAGSVMLGASAHAQPSASGSARGVVFDSVAGAPLRGAVVQAALVDSAGRNAPRVFTATTDESGRYRIDSLPSGKFAIGFQHNALSALGLESPLVAFQFAGAADMVIDLAIPGGATVRTLQCPAAPATDGMLAGFVLDASRGATLTGSSVEVSWVEMDVVEGRLQTVPRRVVSTVAEDGAYLACGMASGTPLNIEVASAGFRTVIGEISVPEGEAIRRDFRLADSAGARAVGAVTGQVTYADGRKVTSGNAGIPVLGVDASIVDGAFSIPGVQAGTWMLEARVIGYEPQSMLVDVVQGAPVSVPITLGAKVQLLDAVSVIGTPGRNLKTLSEIAERRRTSFGTVFLRGNSWLESALLPEDAIRTARGFTQMKPRGCEYQKGVIAVYLDGFRFPQGLGDVVNQVPMKDILAIEAYPDMMGVPPQWRTSDACAVIAVWSKR